MTNERPPTHFIHSLKSLVLSQDTKTRMRRVLSSYVDLHTMPEGVAQPVRSPFSGLFVHTRSLYASGLALLLILAGGTQASMAAEDTVPGDMLYSMKVSVSEPLAYTLAVSMEQKAELAARFASRRVDEAATLAVAGKLDEKTAEELAERFDTHVDTLAKDTDSLEAKGDIKTSLLVRTELEQKLATRVEEFAVSEVAIEDTANAVVADDHTTADRFTARVFAKSQTLATTRERLENALALDLEAKDETEVDLALLREDAPEEVSSRLFFAKQSAASVSAEATTTASTTEEVQATSTMMQQSESLFFGPFKKR